jgi:hypothetical protein
VQHRRCERSAKEACASIHEQQYRFAHWKEGDSLVLPTEPYIQFFNLQFEKNCPWIHSLFVAHTPTRITSFEYPFQNKDRMPALAVTKLCTLTSLERSNPLPVHMGHNARKRADDESFTQRKLYSRNGIQDAFEADHFKTI